MKGIVHFTVGLCAATFIPGVVEAGAAGSPLIALGGVAGLAADTLDFRFGRYIYRYDDQIALGQHPKDLDPQSMADRIAAEMNAVLETGKSKSVQLQTMQLGIDRWQQYRVQFIPDPAEVVVTVGPAVSTSQAPFPGGFVTIVGRSSVQGVIQSEYGDEFVVDIFSGPSFRFEKYKDGVRVQFLPWHRSWSHSLVLAAVLGVLAGALFGWRTGAVISAGWAAHSLVDQLGYMGSNLFWPLTRKRMPGLRLVHSGDALANMLSVWAALMLTLWNLDRFSAIPWLKSWLFLLLVVVLPFLIVAVSIWQRLLRQARPY
ncbi:MAG: metal-dependent hydrolase [Anaerolineales bacterium]|nr:metal-dependent hydrolase [Anaerolineales bacterium]